MSVTLKSPREIEIMREAGRIVANTLQELRQRAEPGMTTKELDRLAETAIRRQGAEPAFPYINDFPGSLCISINEQVVHGIPGKRRLQSGDLVKMDAGAIYKGYHGDAAITVGVGSLSEEAQRLLDVTDQSLAIGIDAAQPGAHLNDIGAAIEGYISRFGFSAVRQYAGHGIGTRLHEEPSVAHYRQPARGMVLRPGMVLTIEPMINAGTYDTITLNDGWTVVTRDRRLSAQFEHTIAITESGPEILTLPDVGEAWGVPKEMAKRVH
ncbi:MAG TPA: type I methionyl aminopeptidase [Chloroflexota bacterium]|nr:type I methionyl aminopeptidase [Chloroflexota bacterium]